MELKSIPPAECYKQVAPPALRNPKVRSQVISTQTPDHLIERRNRALDFFQRVVDVRTETQTAGRRNRDMVLRVERIVNLPHIKSIKTHHRHPRTQFRLAWSA